MRYVKALRLETIFGSSQNSVYGFQVTWKETSLLLQHSKLAWHGIKHTLPHVFSSLVQFTECELKAILNVYWHSSPLRGFLVQVVALSN